MGREAPPASQPATHRIYVFPTLHPVNGAQEAHEEHTESSSRLPTPGPCPAMGLQFLRGRVVTFVSTSVPRQVRLCPHETHGAQVVHRQQRTARQPGRTLREKGAGQQGEWTRLPCRPLVMTQRSNIVKLRLTDLEKQDWQTAAGGARQLSAWMRSVCNAAAQPAVRPGMTDLMVSPEAIDAALAADPPPNEKPKLVRDAVERAVNETGVQGSGLAKQLRAPAQCDRWMHHRPGVYCGSCKKVIAK